MNFSIVWNATSSVHTTPKHTDLLNGTLPIVVTRTTGESWAHRNNNNNNNNNSNCSGGRSRRRRDAAVLSVCGCPSQDTFVDSSIISSSHLAAAGRETIYCKNNGLFPKDNRVLLMLHVWNTCTVAHCLMTSAVLTVGVCVRVVLHPVLFLVRVHRLASSCHSSVSVATSWFQNLSVHVSVTTTTYLFGIYR